MALMVLQAALLEDIKLLKATLKRFLSSEDRVAPLLSRTGFKKLTISSNLSACSATLAMNMCSSSDIFKMGFEFKLILFISNLELALFILLF